MATGNNHIPFTKKNYLVMGAGLAITVFGYFLMAGEKFVDATQFSVSLYVCPFIIIAGLIVIGAGIMVRNNPASTTPEDSQKQ